MEKSRISSFLIVSIVTVLHLCLGWLLAQSNFQKAEIEDLLQNLQMVDVDVVLADVKNASVDEIGEEPSVVQPSATQETNPNQETSVIRSPQPQPTPQTVSAAQTTQTVQPQPTPQPEKIITTKTNTVADVVKAPDVKAVQPTPQPKQPESVQPPKPIVQAETVQPVIKPEVKTDTVTPSNTASQTVASSANTDNKPKSSQATASTTSTTSTNSTSTKIGTTDGRSSAQSGSSKDKTQGTKADSPKMSGNASNANVVTKASLGAGYGSSMTGACSDLSDEADDEGRVKLKVTVDERGKAKNVQILSSSGVKRLDNQAKRIAQSHTYSPAKSDGKAVAGDVVFTMDFKCGNAA